MTLQHASRTIDRVRLIDDDADVRSGYRFAVEDMSLSADEVSGPIADVEQFASTFQKSDAAICDLQLTTKNYSAANGDVVVARLYTRGIPAVLCTRWAGHLPEPVRYRRRQIPVVLSPNNLSADSISVGIAKCLDEFAGEFSRDRRPWRALVRVEGAEEAGGGAFRLKVVVPSWDQSVGLTYVVPPNVSTALAEICRRALRGDIVRAFAQVNLGVDCEEDVYVDNWSLP